MPVIHSLNKEYVDIEEFSAPWLMVLHTFSGWLAQGYICPIIHFVFIFAVFDHLSIHLAHQVLVVLIVTAYIFE